MKLAIEKDEYVNKTFRLNKKLAAEMEKARAGKGISLNKLVDLCIRYALENLDRSGDNK